MGEKSFKIGFIGFGNHALRLHSIISGFFSNVQFKLYNHRKGYDNAVFGMENVYSLDDLLDCNAVIVSSPNDTHFSYLKNLIENYSGYVFCEKPPVTECKDIDFLEGVSEDIKNRFYFNFNYRFSPYLESLKFDPEKYDLGRLISTSIIQGHGLALKECYANNWRSKSKTHKTGVFETFSIHYFDILIYMFGFPKKYVNYTASLSPFGDSVDNSMFSCQFENDSTLNLTVSYTTPKISKLTFVYENGIVQFDKGKKVFAPRDTFNGEGRFKEPPLIYEESFGEYLYEESLEKSVLHFCNVVKNSEKFDVQAYEASINTNKLLFCT